MSPPCCRSYMPVSISRTIGYEISPGVSVNSGIGPTLIIWCTIGVSASLAPAMRAMRGLHTPQQITQLPVSMSPCVVRTAVTRGRIPSAAVSMPSTSVLASTRSAPDCWACSRMRVPARSESTTPTAGKCAPPRITDSSRNGTSLDTSAGVITWPAMTHAFAALHRLQFVHALLRAGYLEPAALGEHPEFGELLGAVTGEFHHHLRVLDRVDEVGSVARGTARVGHRPLVHQNKITPAEQRQVVGEAVADDARADDDSACPGRCFAHAVTSCQSLVRRLRLGVRRNSLPGCLGAAGRSRRPLRMYPI